MLRRFLALAVVIAVALVPIDAQTRRVAQSDPPYDYEYAAARDVRNLPVSDVMRETLRALIASEKKQVLSPILARSNCFVNSVTTRAVDLNGDDMTEVASSVLTYCREGGPMGPVKSLYSNWVFIQSGAGWRVSRMVPGQLASLELMENGFLLIVGGQPAGETAVNPVVQRFNGEKYEPWCTIQKFQKPIRGTQCAADLGKTVTILPDFSTRAERVRHLHRIGVPTTLCSKTEAELKASDARNLRVTAEVYPDCRPEVAPLACAILSGIKTVPAGPDYKKALPEFTEAAVALRGIRTGKFERIDRDIDAAIEQEHNQCASPERTPPPPPPPPASPIRANTQEITLSGKIDLVQEFKGRDKAQFAGAFQEGCTGCAAGTPVTVTLTNGKSGNCNPNDRRVCRRVYSGDNVVLKIGGKSWDLRRGDYDAVFIGESTGLASGTVPIIRIQSYVTAQPLDGPSKVTFRIWDGLSLKTGQRLVDGRGLLIPGIHGAVDWLYTPPKEYTDTAKSRDPRLGVTFMASTDGAQIATVYISFHSLTTTAVVQTALQSPAPDGSANLPPPAPVGACPAYRKMQAESDEMLALARMLENDNKAYEGAVADILFSGYDSDFARLGIEAAREENIPQMFKDDATTRISRSKLINSIREKATARRMIAVLGLSRNRGSSPILPEYEWVTPAILDYFCSPKPESIDSKIWSALLSAGYIDFDTFAQDGYQLFAGEAERVVMTASLAASLGRIVVSAAGRTLALRAAQAALYRSILENTLPTTTSRAIGSVYRTLTAAEANAPFLAKGYGAPYAPLSRAREVILNSERRFLRFDSGNDKGLWMVRHAEVEGLTAAQIKDKLALPSIPTHVSDVIVPSGSRLRIGIASPQPGWGAGGGIQIRVEAVGELEMQFLNRRPIP